MSVVLSFDVGVTERHQVELSREGADLKIRVDGYLVETDSRWFSLRLTSRYEFTVGQAERHAVLITKKRKLMLAPFRPSRYQVFVDGQLAFAREA